MPTPSLSGETKARLADFIALMRLNRPIGILLLLWPTLWALWIAGAGSPDPALVVIFTLGVGIMRTAGCVINDYADRDLDCHVERTRDRPVTSGRIRPDSALRLFLFLCLLAFCLVLLTDPLTIKLSVVAVALATLYPFMKRLTHLPQLFLGTAFAWSIPMAFAAQSGGFTTQTWLLFLATILWTVAYDTQYAMVDREDDLQLGIRSTAILFNRADRLIIALLQLGFLALLLVVGLQLALGPAFYGGLCVAGLLLGYQQVLIRKRQREQCFQAFLNNNWVGLVIFAGLLVDLS